VKFRIGSLTKQFTAALILLLQDDHKVSISDPVGRYLPDLPATWQTITLAQLLGHSSGIPDFTQEKDFAAWSQSPHPWPETVDRLKDEPLEFPPGTRFAYSSTNYLLLGAVAERVGGEPLGELLRQRIFTPLGMTDTGLDEDGLVLARRAQGYRILPNGRLAHDRPSSLSVAWAAGAMYSTSPDLLRWQRGLFGGKLLSAKSLQEMMTAGLGGSGLGVSVSNDGDQTVIWDNGAIEGFNSYMAYAPKEHLSVIVLGNVFRIPTTDRLAASLLDVALRRIASLPHLNRRELDRFAGVYDLPGFSLTFRRNGDTLDSVSDGTDFPTIYEGLKEGHPSFYVPAAGVDIAFVPDADGVMGSLVLYRFGGRVAGRRR
jgi:CubicO group peptidase (beta-lactamase class C family)